MTAPPLVRQPDVEAWVWANLRHLPGVTSFCFSQVRQVPGWIVAASIQVDARAPRRTPAAVRAEDARLAMMALPGADWPEGTVSHVAVTEGPFFEPDDDGRPRYLARYEVRVHPRRDAIPAAGIGGDTGRPAATGSLPAGRASRKEPV